MREAEKSELCFSEILLGGTKVSSTPTVYREVESLRLQVSLEKEIIYQECPKPRQAESWASGAKDFSKL